MEIWQENQLRLRLIRKKNLKKKKKKTRDYLKLNFKYPEFSIGFRWVLRARCGDKFDALVAEATDRIEDDYTRTIFLLLLKKIIIPNWNYWFF